MRPSLKLFADDMERKLQKNDHKTGWLTLPVEALLRKLEIELEELKVAVQFEGDVDAMDECVDVANFAMMLYDRIRMDWLNKAKTVEDKDVAAVMLCLNCSKPMIVCECKIAGLTAGEWMLEGFYREPK